MNINKLELKEFINYGKKMKRYEMIKILSDMKFKTFEEIKQYNPYITANTYESIKKLNTSMGNDNMLLLEIYDKYNEFDKIRRGGGSGAKSLKKMASKTLRKNSKLLSSAEKLAKSAGLGDLDNLIESGEKIGKSLISQNIPLMKKVMLHGSKKIIDNLIDNINKLPKYPMIAEEFYDLTEKDFKRLIQAYNKNKKLIKED